MAINLKTATKPSFLEEVIAATPGDSRLMYCIQCGTCGGSCPSASAMDHTPRSIFAMIRSGMREEVLKSNTPWMCVSCYFCTVRCPQEIHITDIMYTRLPSMTPMALGMLTKKGMSPLPPKRIKGMNQLKKILQRAKELEVA
jgi:heterodisulfide reductase subunit C